MSSQFLSPQQILDLSRSPDGKKIVFSYIVSARIARAVQEIFEKFDIPDKPGLQTAMCRTIWDSLFVVPQAEIMAWIESAREIIEENLVNGRYFTDEEVGHC